jgi:hypothetical protein
VQRPPASGARNLRETPRLAPAGSGTKLE